MQRLAIDLDSLTRGDWARVRDIAAEGGVDLATVDLASPPVPVVAALIYVAKLRAGGRITPERCVRLALAAAEEGEDG